MATKRFVLFVGWNYYPDGGWNDHRDSFDTLEEAKEDITTWGPTLGFDWWHIVDSHTGKIVASSRK